VIIQVMLVPGKYFEPSLTLLRSCRDGPGAAGSPFLQDAPTERGGYSEAFVSIPALMSPASQLAVTPLHAKS
jgi:hypothetical protein